MDEIKIVDIHKSESEIYIMQHKPMKTLFNKLKSYCNGEVIIDDVDKRLIGFVFVGDKKIMGLFLIYGFHRNIEEMVMVHYY